MRTIPLDMTIDGIPGALELREPSIAQLRPHMVLMQSDTQQFMFEVLSVSLYADGQQVPDVLDKIGMSELSGLMPLITDMLGFGDSGEG